MCFTLDLFLKSFYTDYCLNIILHGRCQIQERNIYICSLAHFEMAKFFYKLSKNDLIQFLQSSRFIITG